MKRLTSAALLALLALPVGATAAQPRVTLPSIEGEVMCTVCGTLLALSDSPQAGREKLYISRLIAAGKSRSQIKDALVAQYGPGVLALPRASGFDLSAYLVPAIGFALAAAALAIGVLRWRRHSPPGGPPPPGRTLSEEDAARLNADLARYDL